MLGITPALGGLFTADDQQYGKHRVVILSEGLWKRRYGGDRDITGKNIQINREGYRVAGVIQPLRDAAFKAALWTRVAFPPAEVAPGISGPHYIEVIGRLKPGITIEQARDEFSRVAPPVPGRGMTAGSRSVCEYRNEPKISSSPNLSR
jgi:putative ABC transport system permease protein